MRKIIIVKEDSNGIITREAIPYIPDWEETNA